MDPQWIIAACAAAGLMITWTTTIVGAALWVVNKIGKMKQEILADFHAKHQENTRKVAALETLVIRHDTILDPEFNGSGRMSRGKN